MDIKKGDIVRIKRLKNMDFTRPLLVFEIIKIKDTIWYYGFPICHEVEYAGKGDPFFEGEKEGLSYPFFVELYNPIFIPQEYILNRIGEVDEKGIEEIKFMHNNKWWTYEESPFVKKFRQREITFMEGYKNIIKNSYRILIFIKTTRQKKYFIINGLIQFPVYRAKSESKSEEKMKAIRKLTILIENYKKELSIGNILLDEALFLLYLLQNKIDRAKGILKRINIFEKKREMEKLMKEEKREIEKKLNTVLSKIEKKMENGEVF
jgi:hypothetical protein